MLYSKCGPGAVIHFFFSPPPSPLTTGEFGHGVFEVKQHVRDGKLRARKVSVALFQNVTSTREDSAPLFDYAVCSATAN